MKNNIFKKDYKIEYKQGPMKKIERCQSKFESDYAHKPFPNSAQLLGMTFV